MPGGPIRQARPTAPTNQAAPGSQQQVRQQATYDRMARPITGQAGQPRPGMGVPQNTMPGRPQQPQTATMGQGARPSYQQYPASRPQVTQLLFKLFKVLNDGMEIRIG